MRACLLGVLFGVGVLLAGSDGKWWPWANVVGAGLIVVFGVMATKGEEK